MMLFCVKGKFYTVDAKSRTVVMGLDLDNSVVVEMSVYGDFGDRKYLVESNCELLLADRDKWGNFFGYFFLRKCTVFLIDFTIIDHSTS